MSFARALLALLLTASAVSAFSGNGRELVRRADAYLLGRGADERERAEIEAMDTAARLEAAAQLLKEAAPQATSPREQKLLDQRLGSLYNKLSIEYHTKKQFQPAIDAARQALQYAGDESPVLHQNIGAMYLDSGDYYNAALELERARDLAGETEARAGLVDQLVAAYVKDGQTRDKNSYSLAAQALEDELSRKPEETSYWTMLGRCRLLMGDPAAALDAWKQARQLRPFSGDMEEEYKRLVSAVAVKRDFVKNESRHFVIEFDDKRHANLAERLLELFEASHDELGERLGITGEASEKIMVSVYTSDQFDRTVRVPWAGGVHQENRIDLRVNPKWTDEDYADTVLHEYTHHLVSRKAASKRVPAWLQEGLAMAQEKKLDRRPFYRRLVRAQQYHALMPMAELEEGFAHFDSDIAILAYGESLDFVAYLLSQHGINKVLKMLEGLGEGATATAAFEGAFGTSLESFEAAWRSVLEERVERAIAKGRERQAQASRVAGVTTTGTASVTANSTARAKLVLPAPRTAPATR